jgi:glyoxylase-like metal-dependent hydrolase (beta-lactamase superfamily II)
MRELAPGLWQLDGRVRDVINTYLIATPQGDVLIDGGTRWVTGIILRQLRGRKMAGVALTHVHPDHQGAAAEVCTRYRVPLACHEADADVMEGKKPMQPRTAIIRIFDRLWSGPRHPVATRFKGGELLGEWRVVHAPGHTPGHTIYFRQRDAVAIAGDVVRNASLRRGFGRLDEPPFFFSTNPMENRRSIRKLLELRPSLICFGHGPEMRDLGPLERYVAKLERR